MKKRNQRELYEETRNSRLDYLRNEYLKASPQPSQKYEKQDLKDLYSLITSFDGLILEAAKNVERRKLPQNIGGDLNKK